MVEDHFESVKDFESDNFSAVGEGDLRETLDYLCKEPKQNFSSLIVIGSFSLMPETREFFGYEDESDDISLQENYDILKECIK